MVATLQRSFVDAVSNYKAAAEREPDSEVFAAALEKAEQRLSAQDQLLEKQAMDISQLRRDVERLQQRSSGPLSAVGSAAGAAAGARTPPTRPEPAAEAGPPAAAAPPAAVQ